MTRSEAGNLLMVGAGVISALHTALFAIWVSALGSELYKITFWISIFGVIFILFNAYFWYFSREKFQKKLEENNDNDLLDKKITAGLMLPFLLILVGWIMAVGYSSDPLKSHILNNKTQIDSCIKN
jgi:threonine/homoserine/homoserine lactone efflux protein